MRETTGKVSSQSLTEALKRSLQTEALKRSLQTEALKRSLRTEALKRSLRTARSHDYPEMAVLRLKVNTSKSQVSDVAI
ncbi:MAG: hypothetical protein ACLFWI_20210 [Coleofasciculus sp.]|uniref:hypothetical protein n=1 Tax=Coleofasciculus sp. TaxID=3100458 RepID=UPI003A4391D6